MGCPKKISLRLGKADGREGDGDGLGGERTIALLCKHFNLSATYVEDELPYDRWICYFAVCLDLEEIEEYRRFWVSGRNPAKFKWASADHAGTRPGGVGDGLLAMAKAMAGGNLKKKDVWEYATATGRQKVYQMAELDSDTGKFIRNVYVDQDGKPVDTTGYVVVESHHPEANAEAARVVGALASRPN